MINEQLVVGHNNPQRQDFRADRPFVLYRTLYHLVPDLETPQTKFRNFKIKEDLKIYGIFVSKNGTRMDPKDFFSGGEEA